MKLLIANRGEIAIRISRAAADLGVETVSIYSDDDAGSLHRRTTDEQVRLPGTGAAAYLDARAIVDAARASGCDAVHPGYGFLSEKAGFAAACIDAGLVFVGPRPDTLALFGDKARARELAETCGVPVVRGTSGATSLDDAREFMRALGPSGAVMVKAVAGGGGRGMRAVFDERDLDDAYARCRSEARAAFACDDVYVEHFISGARHIEIQVIGDGSGRVTHLWERECTLQRRFQKLVEIAPSPGLPSSIRQQLIAAATRMAKATAYMGIGTFEFLWNEHAAGDQDPFYFIEANPRLQVEHTVSEAVTGVDLVATQLRLAAGATLSELGLPDGEGPTPNGIAVQVRINLEEVLPSGVTRPSSGTLTAYEPPGGPGIRVDGYGYAGYATSLRYDSLLAKLIVHASSGDYAAALKKAARGLREFRIEGVRTNRAFLQALLQRDEVVRDEVDTGFVEAHAAQIVAAAAILEPLIELASRAAPSGACPVPGSGPLADDGLAGLEASGAVPVAAAMAGLCVEVSARAGDVVAAGQVLAVVEAMKVEAQIRAERGGLVRAVAVGIGDIVELGQRLFLIDEAAAGGQVEAAAEDAASDSPRADLQEVHARHEALLDRSRQDAVARRHRTSQRTARENVADLCDEDSFTEYGGLTLPMQRSRRSVDDLIRSAPADGLVAGIGTVNASAFGPQRSSCAVLAYDYTVFAGTQGFMGHRKTDRIFELAAEQRLPVIIFTEGGGGRPGDTDYVGVSGLELRSFTLFARLSALVPLIGINSGRCFAGNAALLGCCDVVIATRNSTIGMAGPAMIEGGGLGVFSPEEVGPIDVQSPNGVVDLVVEDEAEGVAAAKRYLSYFQGSTSDWTAGDQTTLRGLIPASRRRVYDVRAIILGMADSGSVLELRAAFGVGIVTALARIEGRAVGIIANNPMHLGGAVDAAGADKSARFMQLCDAFEIPIVSLCDTPGFMVGPEAERTATVRHFGRLFVTGANLQTPILAVILRKAYGLGAQGMLGGNIHRPLITLAWPTGELGPMGLEGAVRLAYRRELAAIEGVPEKQAFFDAKVAELYQDGKAVNAASFVELDDVIDPADTRRLLAARLRSIPLPERRTGKRRPMVDTW